MVVENNSTKGLPGLKSIRNAVGLTQEQVALAICNKVHLGQIELGNRDCTQAVQRQIADRLCCKVSDLFEPSLTPERLDQIHKDFELRKAREVIAQHEAQDKKAGAA